MKRLVTLMVLMLCSVLPSFSQTDTSAVQNIDVEWVAVDLNKVDSVTAQYFLSKRLATFDNPKIEESGLITVVVNYLADVFDNILTSLTDKTEQFYNTKLGTITILMLAYGYAGSELVYYMLGSMFVIALTLTFTLVARKYMVFRTIKIEYKTEADDPNKDEIEYKFQGINVPRNYIITIVFLLIIILVVGCEL